MRTCVKHSKKRFYLSICKYSKTKCVYFLETSQPKQEDLGSEEEHDEPGKFQPNIGNFIKLVL